MDTVVLIVKILGLWMGIGIIAAFVFCQLPRGH